MNAPLISVATSGRKVMYVLSTPLISYPQRKMSFRHADIPESMWVNTPRKHVIIHMLSHERDASAIKHETYTFDNFP